MYSTNQRVVRQASLSASRIAVDILNSFYAEGIVPTQWKKGIVVPIPKKKTICQNVTN